MRLLVPMGGGRGSKTADVCRVRTRVYGLRFTVHACPASLPFGADPQATGQRLTRDYITNLPQAAVLGQYSQI